jgi:predicted DNA-binding protein (MmcQ/YjbR family)
MIKSRHINTIARLSSLKFTENYFLSLKTDLKTITKYCLEKSSSTASYPFGEGALVFKVLDKMFALIAEEADPLRISLKCDPEDAQALRAEYPAITGAYHMNKEHWNGVLLDGSLPDELVFELIDHSYTLVVKGMKKADRERLLGPEDG